MSKRYWFALLSIVLAFCVSPALAQDRILTGITAAQTTGDADGIVGMHELCRAEFPGTRMCSTADIVRNGIEDDSVFVTAISAWVHPSTVVSAPPHIDQPFPGFEFLVFDSVSGLRGFEPGMMSCFSWTSDNGDHRGVFIRPLDALMNGGGLCSGNFHVACCSKVKTLLK